MQQRLGLAQAMLHDPELLILDEPTDGVDPVGRAEIRDILGRLKSQGKTIFLNSHLLQEIELVCDRVAILGQGKLRRMDSVEAMRRRPRPKRSSRCGPMRGGVRRVLNGRTVLDVPAGRLRASANHGRGPRSRRAGPLDRRLATGRNQHRGGRPTATDPGAGFLDLVLKDDGKRTEKTSRQLTARKGSNAS